MNKNKNKKIHKLLGFTIVELAVIIAVIGVLAALGIAGYGSWRKDVARNEVKSDLNAISAGMSAKRNFSNGYPLTLPDNFSASTNVLITYVSGDASAYCIDARSKAVSGVSYFIDSERTDGEPRYGTCASGEIPLDTPTGPGWDSTIAGTMHKCAVASGIAYCWGDNTYGQLGNGTYTSSSTPVAVSTSGALSGKTVTAVEAAAQSTCAIADGSVYCWGRNDKRQLGYDMSPTWPNNSTVPVAMNTLHPSGLLVGKTVTVIEGNAHHYCVIANAAVYCWGENFYSQLGNGGTALSTQPTAVIATGVVAGKTPTALATTANATCAVYSGSAYCWGTSEKGQNGTTVTTNTAREPRAVDASGVLSGKTITAIAGSYYNFCVIASGSAYCWGYNAQGQLGDGIITSATHAGYYTPIAFDATGVLAGKTITAVVTGSTTCVIASGKVYCSGSSSYGELGNGAPLNDPAQHSAVPVAVIGPLATKTATGLNRGYGTICAAVGTDAYCWGQVGHLYPISSPNNSSTPIKINGPQ